MTTLELLSQLRSKDIRIWIEGEKLRFRAPERAMTPELQTELTARKSEVMQFLTQFTDHSRAEMPPIGPAPRDRPPPLSFSQERLWFLDELDPGVPIYNLYGSNEFRKPLDVEALQRAFTEVVRRHEILRTTFQGVEGIAVQIIAPPSPFPLPVIDLSGLPPPERAKEANRLEVEEARAPFDLRKGPLLRAKLVRFQDSHHRLLFSIHHIIMDDWSRKLFDQELDTLYTAFSQRLPSPLPELPIQYADFVVWQRGWLQGRVLESYVDYWADQLKGDLPTLDLPTDRPRGQSSRGAEGKFTISRSLSRAIKALSDREGVTPFMTFIAAYSALLSRYTGQEDIIIGSPIADRNQPETTHLIGFLLNTLVLRTNLSGDPTFREFLRQVREVCLGAHAHQEVPYEALLQRLHPNRNLSGSPLFQTMFVLLNSPAITRSSKGLWGEGEANVGATKANLPDDMGEPFKAGRNNGTSKFDLSFVVVEEKQSFHGITEYNTDLFDHTTIASLVERLQTLMQSAVARPEQRISELLLMTEAERRELLEDRSGRKEEFSEGPCIQHLFEARAERSPETIAVEFDGKSLSYAELNSRANQWGRFLQKLGAGPEAMVGIFLERSLEMLLAMLGTLKAGATYVPLDPSYPQKRLALMMEDVQVKVLLTRQHLLASLPEHSASTVCVDTMFEEIAAESGKNFTGQACGESLVCVLYTSGSTGIPKGVMIRQKALVNYALTAIRDFRLVEGDRVLQFASAGFDTSLEEIYPCLAQGATLVLRPDQMLDSVAVFLSNCRQMRLTVLDLPTAYWHEIISRLEMEEMPPTLRLIIIGGERVLPEKFVVWQKFLANSLALVNTYGPTEGTIAVTRCELPGVAVEGSAGREVPIGWPVENSKIYVLDRSMRPAPVGVPGELYIGGTVLARGYLNRPDLTAAKFVPDPFSDQSGARLYKTGDLARFLSNGSLEYRGRTDHQFKIRGYRIEPGEIEGALAKNEAVKDVVLLAREDDPGTKQLVAYIVLREGTDITASELRNFLKPTLPEYTLPSAFVFIKKLPLNSNGKIDRHALPKPDRSRADFKGELVGPRTATEEIVMSIWGAILRIDRIGVHENFFEMGGHSLLATQVVSRISDTFHIDMRLRRLFELPTIAEMSIGVEELIQVGSSERPRIISLRGLRDEPMLAGGLQNKATNSLPFYGETVSAATDRNLEQMLAAVEALSSQETKALLGEEDQIESG
jgi:amino acid adenylation domain-containing protein